MSNVFLQKVKENKILIKIKDKTNIFNTIVFVIYLISSFAILLFHESWRDEAQSWLISRDLSFLGIIKQMSYEGHPVLWYLILSVFSKLGLPYIAVKLVSWFITSIGVGFIIYKSPFNIIFKSCLIFTPTLLYWYPAVARSYCLIPIAIALIAYFYNRRHEKIYSYIASILLLAFTHIMMYGMVGILLALFYIEAIFINRKTNIDIQKRKIWISLIVVIVCLLFILVPIYISTQNNTDVGMNLNIELNIKEISKTFYNSINKTLVNLYNIEDSFCLNGIKIFLGLILLYEIIKYPKNFLIIFCTVILQLFIYSYIYMCTPQRAGVWNLIIMFCWWIQEDEATNKNNFKIIIELFIVILFSYNIYFDFESITNDYHCNYSSAKETAEYINENIDENSIFVCTNMPKASAVIPYTSNYKYWSPQIKKDFSFVSWNEEYTNTYTVGEFKDMLEEFEKNIYLLYTDDWNDEIIIDFENENYIEPLFESNESIRGEDYKIYKINK